MLGQIRPGGAALVLLLALSGCPGAAGLVQGGTTEDAGTTSSDAGVTGSVQFRDAAVDGPATSGTVLYVERVGGTDGDITAGAYAFAGAGCGEGSGGTFTMAAGVTQVKIGVPLSAAIGTQCVVTLTAYAPASAGAPITSVITVVQGPAKPGTFEITASEPTATTGGAPVTFTITRTDGTAIVQLPYALSGSLTDNGQLVAGGGTLSPPSPVTFAQDQTSATLTYTPPATPPSTPALPATLTVALQNVLGATLGANASASVSLEAGCPPPPADLQELTLGGYGNPSIQKQLSGQIVAIPLPALMGGIHSEQITFGESAGAANTPSPVFIEFTISRCKGVIDQTREGCHLESQNGSYNSMTFFGQPYPPIVDVGSASVRGYCWAPESEGQWYLNARWTYSACAFGASTCGFAIQRNPGPF